METVNKTEIECLIREFYLLLGEQRAHGKAVPGLDRGKFRSMLHHEFNITDDMIMDGGNTSLFNPSEEDGSKSRH